MDGASPSAKGGSDDRTDEAHRAAVIALEGGSLAVGGGLLALLRPAIRRLGPGGMVALLSDARTVAEDLPSWCRIEGHEYLGATPVAGGRWRHLIARRTGGPELNAAGSSGFDRAAPPRTADLITRHPLPERADPHTGFAPRGARVEPGGPGYPFTLVERDRVAPPEVAELYERAVASQWDAVRDIPWAKVRPLPSALEEALAQTMTFLAENELSALYVPSRFLGRIHPAYAEVAMLLASQMADEARHIDVFLKRALATGHGMGVSAATTAISLRTLLAIEDFTEVSFVLAVLGEGTFLDLLRFIEEHAPDEATLEIARRARSDEARHVHFGLGHVRHAIEHDPPLADRLEQAVRRRAAVMREQGIPSAVQDALTILAARGTDPASLQRGHESFRELLEIMSANRLRRLLSVGFSPERAATLAALHTPNFM
jgi:TusA-related sulfurtransferase